MSYNFKVQKKWNITDKNKYSIIWNLTTDEDDFVKRINSIFKGKNIVMKQKKSFLLKLGLKPVSLRIDVLSLADKYKEYKELFQG